MKPISRSVISVVVLAALASPAVAQYKIATLASFNSTNGANPFSGLVADAAGNLYGTTLRGGANNDGTVFEIAAGTHALSTLVSFNGANGRRPLAGLYINAAGDLFGTTEDGGADDSGTLFEIAAGTHTLTTLASFFSGTGQVPHTSLIADAAGNLYGTTLWGGANNDGTVFKVTAGTNTITVLASLHARVLGSLLFDASGNLYGTTVDGGANNAGTVFELAAGTHTITILASFNNTNGANPRGGLVADAAGNLYGTTELGGTHGRGTVFELAAGTHNLTTLVSFNGTNGNLPFAGLIADAAGNLYGTTESGGTHGRGTVFELAAGTHNLTTLVSFNGTNGDSPQAALIVDAAGNLYGTTVGGGASGRGTVFKLSPIPEPSGIVMATLGAIGLIAASARGSLLRHRRI